MAIVLLGGGVLVCGVVLAGMGVLIAGAAVMAWFAGTILAVV
jgi:hypothetical protein